ncbi:nucleoporin nup211-like isoform X2 [Zingiber officinale]|uniref:nucleoporin nup211-like isoform X2 n=1 Tax=Zingiber officinale TaxID=94328 RepID=UPI001C4D593F|nr:nucleoporin nup211-like isoform X2 [Zingiber officinale]XP_042373842.1 nucleoporin nup211-like isoform X2 [Zingiber officinale]
MGDSKKSSSFGTERRIWERILESLVTAMRSQQSQIKTLVHDREYLERYIEIMHDRWASKDELLRSRIAKLNEREEKGRKVQAAVLDLAVGIKQREALRFKKYYEQAENDLEDLYAYAENLTMELSALKEKLKNNDAERATSEADHLIAADDSERGESSSADLRGELQKLKHSYKSLSSRKEAEVSALMAEKVFVWNQLNKMESDYTSLLKAKRIEVEQANETTQKLQSCLENLKSLISERDGAIAKLEAERAMLGSDLRRHTQEAERTSKEVEKIQFSVKKMESLVKKKDKIIEDLKSNLAKVEQNFSRDSSSNSRVFADQKSQRRSNDSLVAPEVSQPRRGSRKRSSESPKVSRSKKQKTGSKDPPNVSHASSSTNALQLRSKERQTRTMSPAGSPRLFSSNFKVPKLKDSSPRST